MLKKITKFKSPIHIVICVIALFLTISLSIRFLVFINQDKIFGEWSDFADTLSEELPKERHPFPHDYYMHTIFETYAVKQFRFYDETGTLDAKQIEKMFLPLVNAVNSEFDGNEAKIYIGHEDPYNITPKYFPAKLLYLFSDKSSVNENYWHVIVYKRARLPFWL